MPSSSKGRRAIFFPRKAKPSAEAYRRRVKAFRMTVQGRGRLPSISVTADLRETGARRLAAQMRLIVWCKSCNHRDEPDIATQVAQHGSGMTVIDSARLLRCTECSARDADFVVTGERR
jgi:hypothetical protein